MKVKVFLSFLVTFILYTSCSDSTPEVQPEPELDTSKQLLSFVLEESKNEAYLEEDIVGEIDGGEIKISIPEEVDATSMIATFTHNGDFVLVNKIEQESGVTVNSFTEDFIYTVQAEDKSKNNYTVRIERLENEVAKIPHIYINTDGGVPIEKKRVYIDTDIRIEGGNRYDNFEGRGAIRGRGNSTWAMPKKPYRFKLDQAASLLGLAAERNWVLLQNYIDPSLMCNAVAMRTGQLLEMPFTHHMIPVDVTLNGEYMGNYTFTEHKEVTDNRINVGNGGWLIELETYFDEDYKFYSSNYQLPVMIQYPKLDKMSEAEAQPIFNEMKNDFNALDELIYEESFPNNNYLDYFDADAFVDYIIVYTLTGNEEINHPKSTYVYKKKDEKYCMGPIWDFDWAFGYEGTSKHFVNPQKPLFWTGDAKGTRFFSRIIEDPVIQELYKVEWSKFRNEKYPILVDYIKDYAELIRESHARDQERWGQSSGSVDKYLNELLDWLDQRVDYIDNLTEEY